MCRRDRIRASGSVSGHPFSFQHRVSSSMSPLPSVAARRVRAAFPRQAALHVLRESQRADLSATTYLTSDTVVCFITPDTNV
jgi:hypothetical protein